MNNQSGPAGGSPGGGGRGGVHAEAKQFNPGAAGQKRGRDDAENANVGNGSKRARGGAGAGGV